MSDARAGRDVVVRAVPMCGDGWPLRLVATPWRYGEEAVLDDPRCKFAARLVQEPGPAVQESGSTAGTAGHPHRP